MGRLAVARFLLTSASRTFCVAFHIFVDGERRDFKFGTQVDYSYSLSLRTISCPWK